MASLKIRGISDTDRYEIVYLKDFVCVKEPKSDEKTQSGVKSKTHIVHAFSTRSKSENDLRLNLSAAAFKTQYDLEVSISECSPLTQLRQYCYDSICKEDVEELSNCLQVTVNDMNFIY